MTFEGALRSGVRCRCVRYPPPVIQAADDFLLKDRDSIDRSGQTDQSEVAREPSGAGAAYPEYVTLGRRSLF